MTDSIFLGSDFSVLRAQQQGAATVRVKFRNDPLQVSASGATDGLNPALYQLSGPGENYIIGVSGVPDDPQSLDLDAAVPFITGTWHIICSSAIANAAQDRTLQTPRDAYFEAEYITTATPVNPGAENDDAYQILRRHLNPALQGPNWTSLLHALAKGDEYIWAQAKLLWDQLFMSSASGKYLESRCNDYGISKPQDLGMSDDLYRRLGIELVTGKVTESSLLQILEIFYGRDSVRAYVETSATAPYQLSDGWYLDLMIDNQYEHRVVFRTADFGRITRAKPVEVAAAITRSLSGLGSEAFAVAVIDPITGDERVRIYSGALGLTSGVAVIGGWAQTALQFPTVLDVYNGTITGADAYDWVISHPTPTTTQWTLTTASPKIDLSTVRTEDYVIVEAEYAQVPDGIYDILDVAISYSGSNWIQSFTITANNGYTGAPARQLSNNAYRFYRPSRATINTGANTVAVTTIDDSIHVTLPVTTVAVNRGEGSAAYLQSRTPITIDAVSQDGHVVTVNTHTAHGLQSGDIVQIQGVQGLIVEPTVTHPGGTQLDYSKATLIAEIENVNFMVPTVAAAAATLVTGEAFVSGGVDLDSGTVSNQVNTLELSSAPPPRNYTYGLSSSLFPDMPDARSYHTATVLRHPSAYGRVLIVGGCNGTDILSDSLKAASGDVDWTTLATAQARALHTATILDNEVVLICGGTSTRSDTLNHVEIFDGSSGWSTKASMNQARACAAATAIAGTKALVCGGITAAATPIMPVDGEVEPEPGTNYTLTNKAEIYDYGTNTWTITGGMLWARTGHKAVTLTDGRVLVVGGYGHRPGNTTRQYVKDIEVWNSTTGTWRVCGYLSQGRSNPIVQLLDDGKILVGFGQRQGAVIDGFEYFDPGTGRVSTLPIPYESQGFGKLYLPVSTELADGSVFVCGGQTVSTDKPPMLVFVRGQDTISAGGFNGEFKVVTTPTSTSFTYSLPDKTSYTTATGGEVLPVGGSTGIGIGPYLVDDDGPALASAQTTLAMEIDTGQSYEYLEVANARAFPDEPGYLVLSLGYESMSYPVPYLGRYSDTQLILDYRYRFPVAMPVSSTVTLLANRGPWSAAAQGLAYLTASPAGFVAAQNTIVAAKASGVDLNLILTYPGDNGLGHAGFPVTGDRISDKVWIWGSN